MLDDIEQMKKARPQLDPPERILIHSCWRCARREERSSSESSVSSSSSDRDSSYSAEDCITKSGSGQSSDNDFTEDSEEEGDYVEEYEDSEYSDVEKMNTRQRSSYLLRKEFDRKYRSSAALCDDICFNEPEVGAYGLMCRCSTSARQHGLRHNVFPGESKIPCCVPNENNADKLHHYVLCVTRPSAPLGEGTRTRISHSGESYVFQGLSVFFHRELPGVLPRMPVSRWATEYEFHFEKAPMLDCFTVEELNMFHRYLFIDLLELYDESIRAFNVSDGCPIYHVMPRFISERDQQLLPMSLVLRYLCDSFKPLVTEREADMLAHCTETEIAKILTSKKFQLATNPRKRPSTIRVDGIKRISINESPSLGIEHKTSPPVAYANLKNPELVEAQRRLSKLRQVQSTSSSNQSHKEHLEDISSLLRRIAELKQQRAAMLSTSKVIHIFRIFGDRDLCRCYSTCATPHPRCKTCSISLVPRGVNVDHIKTTLTNCLFRRYLPFAENNEKKKGFRNLMHIMSQSGCNTAGLSKIAHNERLEYLGDAVVELIVSNRLFFLLPHQEEGGLATYRSALKLRLGDWMMYAHGIDLCDEEDFRKSLANTFEAVLAAIYLDGGIEQCDRIFAEAMFGDDSTVKTLWLNVPEHPLKVEQPEGDRMFVEGTDDLTELSDLEDILGFRFQNIRLLAKALTRRNVPYNTLTCGNNQRLEWLGDAVLQLVISDYLYHHFPNHHEGHLSLLRTCLVCNETQSQICEDLGLHNFIVQPPGGSSRLPELSLKDKADLVEALIGAIFVDRGWDYCRLFIYICFLPRLKHFIESKKWNDSKSQLQQCCLALRDLESSDNSAPEMPEYRTIGIEGSTNARHYRVAVYFRSKFEHCPKSGSLSFFKYSWMAAAKKALEEYKEMFSSISKNNVKSAANAFMKKLQEAQQRPSSYVPNGEQNSRPPPLIGSACTGVVPPSNKLSSSATECLRETNTVSMPQRRLTAASPLVKQMLNSVAASYRQFSTSSSSLQNPVVQNTIPASTPLLPSQNSLVFNSVVQSVPPFSTVQLGFSSPFTSTVQAPFGTITFSPQIYQLSPHFVSQSTNQPIPFTQNLSNVPQNLLQVNNTAPTPQILHRPPSLISALSQPVTSLSESKSEKNTSNRDNFLRQPMKRPREPCHLDDRGSSSNFKSTKSGGSLRSDVPMSRSHRTSDYHLPLLDGGAVIVAQSLEQNRYGIRYRSIKSMRMTVLIKWNRKSSLTSLNVLRIQCRISSHICKLRKKSSESSPHFTNFRFPSMTP
ncbi:RNase3 domain protein [Dictyocaulus viviparus]|uniref:RNase3 domain protein n=1 Tax=Dictyocaulus viviparus TaxID=29172 RepID=A0A0D8Y192_DICVI|nr:RNase3 domain protein [Dictyocaulus viviparus]